MSDLILNGIAIAGAFALMSVIVYRIGPGLSEALSAWAAKQDLEHKRIEIWAEGFQEGQEAERTRTQQRE